MMSHGQAVYGFAVVGVDAAPQRPAPPDWDRWTVDVEVAGGVELGGELMDFGEERAVIPLPGLGRIDVRRPEKAIRFAVERPVRPEAIVHPGLVAPAAVIATWAGRASVHASALLVGGAVWALLGDREAGKSTTATLLADRGHELFTDDMLIVDADGTCFAGPSSVDLRGDASGALGGESLGVLGQRERWRRSHPGAVAQAPLGGWIELAWGDGDPAVSEVTTVARLELLGRQLHMPLDPAGLLALADRPALRLTRPADLTRARAGVDLLLEAVLAARA